jgi:hypothetical protein
VAVLDGGGDPKDSGMANASHMFTISGMCDSYWLIRIVHLGHPTGPSANIWHSARQSRKAKNEFGKYHPKISISYKASSFHHTPIIGGNCRMIVIVRLWYAERADKR